VTADDLRETLKSTERESCHGDRRPKPWFACSMSGFGDLARELCARPKDHNDGGVVARGGTLGAPATDTSAPTGDAAFRHLGRPVSRRRFLHATSATAHPAPARAVPSELGLRGAWSNTRSRVSRLQRSSASIGARIGASSGEHTRRGRPRFQQATMVAATPLRGLDPVDQAASAVPTVADRAARATPSALYRENGPCGGTNGAV
jgi:hypothetical protein